MNEPDKRSPARRAAPPRRRANEHDVYAGERLRVARRLAACSQQVLAQQLGVSFQAVQKYENGENRLSAGRLVKAARYLGVDLAFFVKDTGRRDEDTAPASFSPHEIDLIRAYRALPDELLRTQLRQLLLTVARVAGNDEEPGKR
jgi:transcriptional regulator with XRE-family HTH domain